MKYFEFTNPTKLCSGHGALENIPYELEMLGASRPMLLSDAMLEKIGTLKTVTDAMKDTPVTRIFTDIPQDSGVDVVNRIAKEYRDFGCDSLIALGGGSVLDTAKGVKLVISQNADDLLSLMGCECVKKGGYVPFIAIPTTAGTGSEATNIAVIRNPSLNIKMEYITREMLPDTAVIDPRMTATLPPKTTASTGMDTLCHAIEAYSCLQKNPVSDSFAAEAIKLVFKNLVKAASGKASEDVRAEMATASFLAGAAFSNSMVGIVHSIGHALGGVAHVPHGDAMNILLPAGMMFNKKYCGEVYGELLLYMEGPEAYVETPAEKRADRAIADVLKLRRKLNQMTGLPEKIKDYGVDPDTFPKIAETALNDGSIIVNPRPAKAEDIIKILKYCYE